MSGDRRISDRDRTGGADSEAVAAAVALVTQLAFLGLLVALHLLRPDLDPSWRLVSEYVGGRFGTLMVAAFALSALGCLALVVALRRHLGSASGGAGALVLVVSAAALAVAAIFPTDPILTAPNDLSLPGRIHLVGAGVSMVSFPVAALLIVVALRREARYRPIRRRLWLLTAATWAALAVLAILLIGARETGFGPEVAIGWPHRALLLADSVWLLAVAGASLGRSKAYQGEPSRDGS